MPNNQAYRSARDVNITQGGYAGDQRPRGEGVQWHYSTIASPSPEEEEFVKIPRGEYERLLHSAQLNREREWRRYADVNISALPPNHRPHHLESLIGAEHPMNDNVTSSIDWDFGLKGGSESRDVINEDTIHGSEDDNVSGLPGKSAPKNLLLNSLCKVLRSPEQRDALCNLQGNRAQVMIDYLHTVLLEPELPETWLRRHCLIALYKLSESSLLYPHSYSLKETIAFSNLPVGGGSYSDIYKGKLGKTELCLKVVRLRRERDVNKVLKIYAKEAILWGQLRHPNIIPFYGLFYRDELCREICLVSPWMQHGDLGEYLQAHLSPRCASLAYDMASGVSYLHELGLIHRDLKPANVLVNDLERAVITDFGMSFIRTDKTLTNIIISKETCGGTTRWSAPEHFEEETRATMAGDIWALGCVFYQIMTGQVPFANLTTDEKVMKALMSGRKPGAPVFTLDPVKNVILEEVVRCFEANPEERPTCQEIMCRFRLAGMSWVGERAALADALRKRQSFLRATRTCWETPVDIGEVQRVFESLDTDILEILSTILTVKGLRADLCNLKGCDAQLIIDYLYSILLNTVLPEPWFRSHCTIVLYRLCKGSQLYPHCYTLKESIVSGIYQKLSNRSSDILKGSFGGKELRFKLDHLYGLDQKSIWSIYTEQAILLRQLHHPNVMPFYGLYYLNQDREQICFVSPWMRYGNVIEYLKYKPFAPRALFVYDVVLGLNYLHESGLIHGGLKGTNILVNDTEQACIADLGVSTGHEFTQRWAAPELLDDSYTTMETDIWALGCVCLEILTGKLPYQGMKNVQIIKALVTGKPPARPKSIPNRRDNVIWREVDRCWAVKPDERPKCRDILSRIRQAGIPRGETGEVQHDAEQEIQDLQDALHEEEPMDLEAVRKLFGDLRKRRIQVGLGRDDT